MADNNKNPETEENEDTEVITLEYDDGSEEECEVFGIFEALDREYIALIPDNGTDDVYIYRYKELEDDDFDIEDIEEKEEFDQVAQVFDGIMTNLAEEDGEEEE
jgi:uncharacterized protein YrzB (UPF0473 family)